ncbi:MAG: ClpXP protease specificity-enhancing factor [Sodalis sp. (in: enterobacteria)]
MEITQLLPRRPYLLRAFYEWLIDNQLTPHLVVDITVDGVMVPMEFIRNKQIVLNIAPQAVANLKLGNDNVHFSARFSGLLQQVVVPMAAVLAIYAPENGAATMFKSETPYEKVILVENESSEELGIETVISVIDDGLLDNTQVKNSEDMSSTPLSRGGGRPSLRVIK